jgi:hypothetical protein
MRKVRSITAVGAAAAAALLLVVPTPASAHPRSTPTPIVKSDQLAAPFNLAINHGKVYVADGGLNFVGRLRSDGSIKHIADDQPGASGVATSADGRYFAFTTTVTNPETLENSASAVHIWGPRGSRVDADTLAYEQAKNPDQVNTYGVLNPSQCVADFFNEHADELGPVNYPGQVDSHAYSVTAWGDKFVLADAGANDLLKIDRKGRISTLAVLPVQPTAITADFAKANGLPDCAVGVTYNFEPVPTDVEVGNDGFLYVTVLPGGPEGPELGARGKVYRVNPWTGRMHVVASGFLGATNLAIGKHGAIYVAELFGGKISVVRHGHVSTYVELPGVVAVETSRRGQLWAATLGNEDPPAPGTIVKIVKVHGGQVS